MAKKTSSPKKNTVHKYETSEVHSTDDPYVKMGVSTLKRTIGEETRRALGSGRKYNPDIEPCQDPLFTIGNNITIDDPRVREYLIEISKFLQKHSKTPIRKIVEHGWNYIQKDVDIKSMQDEYNSIVVEKHSSGEISDDDYKELSQFDVSDNPEIQVEVPEWENNLCEAFIEGAAKAMAINAAFITRFKNVKGKYEYYVMTSNDPYRIFGNEDRKISEVWFEFPSYAGFYLESTKKAYQREYIGFLTQYSKDKERDGSMTFLFPHISKMIKNNTVSRNCVVLMPKPRYDSIYGHPYLHAELQTSLEKKYLRQYEMITLHKGGMNRFVAFPENTDSDVKKNIVDECRRGMLSRGTVLSHTTGKPVSELFMIVENQIPDLKFDTINSHLSEDAEFTKQAIEGAAQSGALGGSAPDVNQDSDDETLTTLYNTLEQMIKDINFVFYGKEQDSYKIHFKTPTIINSPQDDDDKSNNKNKSESKTKSKPKSEANSVVYDEIIRGNDISAEAHSINEQFINYRGNLFQAGTYRYPDRKDPKLPKEVEYTKEDIKNMTERDVRVGYLEFEHSFDEVGVDLTEGVGYFEIEGFDEKQGKDITIFHVKKKFEKYIDPKRIKVSPYFYRKRIGNKQIMVPRNAAILIKSTPRAELSGLKSEADRI